MNERIIYQNDAGGVSIIIPADCGLTIEEIAAKDVPTGKPYKIVDIADIPTDRSQREAWTVDEADLTSGVGRGVVHTPSPSPVAAVQRPAQRGSPIKVRGVPE